MDKFQLLRRYLTLLKITMISFFLSTLIHVGAVTGYYYYYLYMNPDDPGKKKFYSTTTSSGVNIGGKIVGGGGIQTNHHKSYLLHLVREHYKSLSKMFFVQFSAIYSLILYLFKFFPERSKLQEETMAAFSSFNDPKESSRPVKMTKTSAASVLRRRAQLSNKRTSQAIKEAEEYTTDQEEDSVDEQELPMTPEIEIKKDN